MIVSGGVPELADGHDLGLTGCASSGKQLLDRFIESRRQGIAPRTVRYYRQCLIPFTQNHTLTPESINNFLSSLNCNGGGKLAYYRAIRAFCNWLVRNDYLQSNPISKVDPPKVPKRILPSLTPEEVQHLMDKADSLRDKCIISLLADSGMRLNEVASIKPQDIDWGNYTITIIGKGNKQRRAPFTERTAKLLRLLNHNGSENVWGIARKSIQDMLRRMKEETGIPCNAHSFRRGFACNLHRKGLSTLDIMHLGGWEDLSMVLRYTRGITFEDCLEHYRAVV